MASQLDGFHSRRQDRGFFSHDKNLAFRRRSIFAGQPFRVFFADKHVAVEGLRPFQMRAVVMGMADHNCVQASFALDPLDRLGIEEGYAVPQDVSCWRLDEDGALADAKLGFRPDGDEAVVCI